MLFRSSASKKDFDEIFEHINELGGNAIQIFVSNPMSSRAKFTYYEENADNIKKIIKKNKIFIHSPYTINLARSNNTSYMKKELTIASFFVMVRITFGTQMLTRNNIG